MTVSSFDIDGSGELERTLPPVLFQSQYRRYFASFFRFPFDLRRNSHKTIKVTATIARMKISSVRLFVTAIALLAMAGCAANRSKDFDEQGLATLRPGVSTYSDAVALLGEPRSVAINPDNRKKAVWTYGNAFKMKGVAFVFDADGILEPGSKRVGHIEDKNE